MRDRDDDWPEWVCHYRHGGKTWGLLLRAPNEEDAAERLRAIGNWGKVDGELMAVIPANVPGAGFLARLIVWWKNRP